MTLPSRPAIDTTDGGIGTWIGFTGLGFGVIILYGAVKDVPLFGANGIITNAVTKGQLTHVVDGKTTTSGGKKTSPVVSGFQHGLADTGGKTANQAIGSVGKGIGNQIADTLHIGGIAREIERLPVIGRIINDGGNIFQAGQEIGQNAGRSAGQGIGHAIASGVKDAYNGAKSYLHSLKGIL